MIHLSFQILDLSISAGKFQDTKSSLMPWMIRWLMLVMTYDPQVKKFIYKAVLPFQCSVARVTKLILLERKSGYLCRVLFITLISALYRPDLLPRKYKVQGNEIVVLRVCLRIIHNS